MAGVHEAVRLAVDQRPHPIIPHLVKTFSITSGEVVTAIREASLIRARAA